MYNFFIIISDEMLHADKSQSCLSGFLVENLWLDRLGALKKINPCLDGAEETVQ